MNAPQATPISELRQQVALVQQQPDQAIDMFTAKGFALAQRIAQAFTTSDAVPVAFRAMVEKKSRAGSTWVENPAALGNTLVAIETARSVGMSITAVMQNANVIEGSLRWSGKFIIAAINASGRFTPLRFDMQSRGRIVATYREKLGWNEQKRGFDFADRQVEIDDVVCRAWALPANVPFPPGVHTLADAKAAKLPVVEGAAVSIKMAVEEGWYAKSGSKWQTEMRELMLTYRAGSFFGNIHAPDIVMGMGRSLEEHQDMATVVDVNADGSVAGLSTAAVPRASQPAASPAASAPQTVSQVNTLPEAEAEQGAAASDDATQADDGNPAFNVEAFAERIDKAATADDLDLLQDQLRDVLDEDAVATLTDMLKRRREALQQTPKPASRRGNATRGQSSLE